MIKSAIVGVGAVALVAGLAAAPASAASASAVPGGAGYLASPSAFHTAKVTLSVPRVTCSRTSRTRTVELGLFATRTSTSAPSPVVVSLTVEAACTDGHTNYRAVYRNGDTSSMRVHAGDSVRLILDGVDGYEIDDLTTGSGEGGGSSSPGGEGTPHAGRHVLIGAEVVGAAPHGVRTVFRHPIVNHTDLAKVPHHRQGRSDRLHVGSLHHHEFQVTVV